ncbi:MAG: hypothetical protein KatS3mg031_1273 [Chitinophagales bacterium]|nr:MAG: hypothetical protein KatS3mg031_1273 [Chitinophagales bacterium]
MKNTFFVLGTALLFLIGVTVSGCNSSGEQKSATEQMQQSDEHHEHVDGDEHEHEHAEDEDHMVMYVCPMHPEETSAMPGKCPKCGMDMVKKESSEADSASHHEHMEGGHHDQ